MSYYDTTKLLTDQLSEAEGKAQDQEKIIRDWFIHTQSEYTPSEIWGQVFDRKPPLTSIRRGMTNLSDPTKHDPPPLIKTEQKRHGVYGRLEHVWRCRKDDEGLLLF